MHWTCEIQGAQQKISTKKIYITRKIFYSPRIKSYEPGVSRWAHIHTQILQIDLPTFLSRIVERIWFKIIAFSFW